MKKIIAYRWHTGRASIGIVVYQTNFGNFKSVMTSVPGLNEETDLQHIADYGSAIPEQMAIASIGSGLGKIEDIVLWNEFKATIPDTRIILNEENFKTLVTGGIVEKPPFKIILNDIGWDLMVTIITCARNE